MLKTYDAAMRSEQGRRRKPLKIAGRCKPAQTRYLDGLLQAPGVASSSFATAIFPCSSGIVSNPAPPTKTPILMYCLTK